MLVAGKGGDSQYQWLCDAMKTQIPNHRNEMLAGEREPAGFEGRHGKPRRVEKLWALQELIEARHACADRVDRDDNAHAASVLCRVKVNGATDSIKPSPKGRETQILERE